ncbi:hypothetical protein PV327_000785 [Microctonus hyperodae]|uniref:Uncharacterized protein n=1 Tax=Microctonus hyperodae TaxID=165561 RepID=A0AA39G6V8_MICHY|nr:hypothetical protein PV327_000785 [Microctonus hyperodae]
MSSNELLNIQNKIIDDVPNEVLFKYIKNFIDLKMAQELTTEIMNNLQQKRSNLIEEKKKLNDLHQRVFLMNNDICESVWRFSNKYDLPGVVQRCLTGRVTKRNKYPSYRDKLELLEAELKSLSNEIANIMSNLTKLPDKTTSEDIKQKPDTDIKSFDLKFDILEASMIKRNPPSSKFSLKKPSTISGKYKKR